MDPGRINLRSRQQSLRGGGKRVSQPSNIELAIAYLLFGHDDARLALQSRHVSLPVLCRACFGAYIADAADINSRSACRKLSSRGARPVDPGVGSLTLGNDATIDD